jgi:two-component system cell cycle sensor histidine kinase/response regulator CckA
MDQGAKDLLTLRRVVGEMPAPQPELALPTPADRAGRILSAIDAMDGWVSEFDCQGQMLYVSPNVESVLGFTPEECLLTDCLEIHPDDLKQVVESGRHVRATGTPARNQVRFRHKLGRWIWLETALVAWEAEDGGFRTIALTRDITELKHIEAARNESQTRYRVVSQMSCDMIVEVSAEGRTTYLGPGVEDILGYTPEELLLLDPFSLVHPDDVARIREQFAQEFQLGIEGRTGDGSPGRTQQLMEYRSRHKDGRWLWFETHGCSYRRLDGQMSFLAVSRDVTERKLAEQGRRQLEESLRSAQRLESLGVLAGGIAHDFNNLLTPILGAAGLGLSELPADSAIRARLETIQLAAQRAAALTNQMLAYAGQQSVCVERLDLSKLVGDMQELVTASVAGKTTFDLELASDLPPVEAEAVQISQVVMNLVTNAAEALSDGSGHVRVGTGELELDTAPAGALFAETMVTGRHVYFEVADTGCGMDAETRERIFEPFFTTKFAGRGLGLAAVAGIVRAHRGAIELDTALGRGTRFRVLLPAAAEAIERVAPPVPIAGWRSGATVLVIDDDEAVREVAAEVLSRVGMEILTARDGREGVSLFEEHADRIDVVLLDRTMPTLSGAETFDAIRLLRPDAQVVLVSGYSEERAMSELLGRGLAGFLKKPFAPETLLKCIRQALDAPGGAA